LQCQAFFEEDRCRQGLAYKRMGEREVEDIPCGWKVEGNLIEQLGREIGHQSRVRGKLSYD
jgi:hypothetical protein